VQTSDLVTGIRPGLTKDVTQLRKVAGTLDANKGEIDRALQVLPIKLNKVGRTAIYGSWFNFYLCHFKARVKIPGATVPINYGTGAARCDLG
jgi:phospholipid/cholesterol/gamma-HCH transport system substrate-binding protein